MTPCRESNSSLAHGEGGRLPGRCPGADDLSRIPTILGEIARAKGMRNVAEETGLGRESLYKSLARSGNPEFATVLKVLRSLDLQLRVTAGGASLPDVRTAERPARERTTA